MEEHPMDWSSQLEDIIAKEGERCSGLAWKPSVTAQTVERRILNITWSIRCTLRSSQQKPSALVR